MALYRPDYKLIEAKKHINSLDLSVKENDLIHYYIKKNEERLENLRKENDEYREWFKRLDRFLPNKNPIFK
jgi:Tfp pilus assembly protein PilO